MLVAWNSGDVAIILCALITANAWFVSDWKTCWMVCRLAALSRPAVMRVASSLVTFSADPDDGMYVNLP
jgi:hypothetical protein